MVTSYAASIGFQIRGIEFFANSNGTRRNIENLVHLKKSEVGSSLPDMEEALDEVVVAAFATLENKGAERYVHQERFYIITNYSKDENYEVTGRIQKLYKKRGLAGFYVREMKRGIFSQTGFRIRRNCVLTLDLPMDRSKAARTQGQTSSAHSVEMDLGYLTEIELHISKKDWRNCFAVEFIPERRMMLQGKLEGRKEDIALNDIVVARAGSIRVIHFNIYVNGQLLNSYQVRTG